MKICFFNVTASLKAGGLETYCWEVGKALSKRGHEVTIVAGEGGHARHTYVDMKTFPFRRRETFPNFGTRFRKLMERLSFAKAAGNILADEGFDAVVVNKPFDFVALKRARKAGFAGQTAFRSGGTDFYFGDGFFASVVDHWISSSRYNAKQVEERYGRPVTVLHNGVDPDVFTPRDKDELRRLEWGVPADAPLVMSMGRLVGWKGLETIIDVLPRIPALHYAVVGDGEAREALTSHAKRVGVADRVHFLGEVAHVALPGYLNQADFFVQPSVGEEAFGISVVEAMACGLPVVGSINGGIVEIIIDNKTGRLLPAGEVEAWTGAIKNLIADSDRLGRMGAASRQRVLDHFTWEANARRLEKLLLDGAA